MTNNKNYSSIFKYRIEAMIRTLAASASATIPTDVTVASIQDLWVTSASLPKYLNVK